MTTPTHDTYRAAHGRWREVLSALGMPAEVLGRKQQPCPMCGGEDRFQFTDRSGEGDYICRGCGAGKGMKLLMSFKGWDFKQAAQEVDKIVGNLPAANIIKIKPRAASTVELNSLWRRAEWLGSNSVADQYLASRGIAPKHSPALKWVSQMRHAPSQTMLPCILARMCDADGRPKQIHRTYLTPSGGKADVEPNRMFMPGELPAGGAIRLGPLAEAMGVAEGIETALSAAVLHRMPVWATTSAVMLEKWEPPPEAKRVTVFGDNDHSFAGQAAAYALAKRLVMTKQIEVEVCLPPNKGTDWNDVLKGSSNA